MCGVKYIDLVSLDVFAGNVPEAARVDPSWVTSGRPVLDNLTWIMPPYVLYGVKYIDLVSLAPFPGLFG